MAPNDNGYGGELEPQCRREEKISHKDVCEPYEEEIKTTQNVEQCEDKPYTNCTGEMVVLKYSTI